MFCPKCGNKLDDGTIFCPKCGARLSNQAVSKRTEKAGSRKRTRKKSVKIIAAVLCIGLFGAAAGFFAVVKIDQYQKIAPYRKIPEAYTHTINAENFSGVLGYRGTMVPFEVYGQGDSPEDVILTFGFGGYMPGGTPPYPISMDSLHYAAAASGSEIAEGSLNGGELKESRRRDISDVLDSASEREAAAGMLEAVARRDMSLVIGIGVQAGGIGREEMLGDLSCQDFYDAFLQIFQDYLKEDEKSEIIKNVSVEDGRYTFLMDFLPLCEGLFAKQGGQAYEKFAEELVFGGNLLFNIYDADAGAMDELSWEEKMDYLEDMEFEIDIQLENDEIRYMDFRILPGSDRTESGDIRLLYLQFDQIGGLTEETSIGCQLTR